MAGSVTGRSASSLNFQGATIEEKPGVAITTNVASILLTASSIFAGTAINIDPGASISTAGGNVSLSAFSANPLLVDGSVSIAGNISTGGGSLSISTDTSITVNTQNNPVTLSTQGGTMQLLGTTITVGSAGGQLAVLNTGGGTLTLMAAQNAVVAVAPGVLTIGNTSVAITLNNSTVNGASVKILASGVYGRIFDNNPSTTGTITQIINTGIPGLKSFTLIGGVAIANGSAVINLSSASTIFADTLVVQSITNVSAEVQPVAANVGAVAVAIDNATTTLTAAGSIIVTGNATLLAQSNDGLVAYADAKGNTLGPTPGVAVAVENSVCSAIVPSGGYIKVGGNLNVQAATNNSEYVLAAHDHGLEWDRRSVSRGAIYERHHQRLRGRTGDRWRQPRRQCDRDQEPRLGRQTGSCPPIT